MTSLEAIQYRSTPRPSLRLLDQKKLPNEMVYEDVNDLQTGIDAIVDMKVRGAPAIAISAALTLAVVVSRRTFASPAEAQEFVLSGLDKLRESRPTAVNLFNMADDFSRRIKNQAPGDTPYPSGPEGGKAVADRLIAMAEGLMAEDVQINEALGRHGTACFPGTGLRILTHCNTGALATTKYGTALGVIRFLHSSGRLAHAFCTETRPYNQGSRLTAFELVYEKIPATLVTDSMVSALIATQGLDGIVVGADRVTANGDTANKIGTYQLAITAKYHGVPFYVASPSTTIDLNMASGDLIPIEQRGSEEVTHTMGGVRVAAEGIGVWNPGFDVTPASLITGIITERGVARKAAGSDQFDLKSFMVGAPPFVAKL